jgi:hypothetical protein
VLTRELSLSGYATNQELGSYSEMSRRRICQQRVTLPSMYEFTPLEEEPEPQASGSRFGPPRKYTGAGLLDPSQFPPIRPRCFGCSQPLAVAEIGQHILDCDLVSIQDLMRFKAARPEFELNPGRAREVIEEFLNRVRPNA